MRAILIFSSIICMHFNSDAQQKNKIPVTSKIDHVTVYLQGAQITRSASANIPQGASTLVFSNISPEIDEKSIQVAGEGKFTILSVARERNALIAPAQREELEQLETSLESLRERIEREQYLLQIYDSEEKILTANQSVGGTQNGSKPLDLKEMLDFQRTRKTELIDKKVATNKLIKKLQADQYKISLQINTLKTNANSTNDLLVNIQTDKPLNGKLMLQYYVKNASWHPTYDIRVENIAKPMNINFRANVYQRSGEDWNNVKLSLSTGNPDEKNTKPELTPWYANLYNNQTELNYARLQTKPTDNRFTGRVIDENGQPIIGATLQVTGRTIGVVTDQEGKYAIQMPGNNREVTVTSIGYDQKQIRLISNNQNIQLATSSQLLQEVVVTGYSSESDFAGRVAGVQAEAKAKKSFAAPVPVDMTESYKPTTVTFDILLPYTIASNNAPIIVNIKQTEAPTIYNYVAIPKLEKSAYLIAGITDWESLNLMEGEANIYFEDTYLGKSLLDFSNAGDTLMISLGKDKNILVNRTLEKDYSKKQLIGNYKTAYKNWYITVRNNRQQPINLTLYDQLPIPLSREVELLKTNTDGGNVDDVTKEVSWKLTIAPGKEESRRFEYGVKFPKDKLLNFQ